MLISNPIFTRSKPGTTWTPVRGPRARALHHLGLMFADMVAVSALSTIGGPQDFSPFPWRVANNFFQAVFVYFCLDLLMHRAAALTALLGFETQPHMHNPLLRSTSLRDFWGRRWNMIIHGLLRRVVFQPLRGVTAAERKPVALHRELGAAFATFAASGLLHEYLWLGTIGPSAPLGGATAFFLLQGAFCTGQALAERFAPELVRGCQRMPRALKLAGTYALLFPSLHWFQSNSAAFGLFAGVERFLPHFEWR